MSGPKCEIHKTSDWALSSKILQKIGGHREISNFMRALERERESCYQISEHSRKITISGNDFNYCLQTQT